MKNHLSLLEIRMASSSLTARGGDLVQIQMIAERSAAPEPIHRPMDDSRLTVRFAESSGEYLRNAGCRFANDTKKIYLL